MFGTIFFNVRVGCAKTLCKYNNHLFYIKRFLQEHDHYFIFFYCLSMKEQKSDLSEVKPTCILAINFSSLCKIKNDQNNYKLSQSYCTCGKDLRPLYRKIISNYGLDRYKQNAGTAEAVS